MMELKYLKLIFAFILVLGLSLLLLPRAEETEAGALDNVAGFAWSDNIGWLSFNCTNTNSCAAVDYGIKVNTTNGKFSGYAWSEHIGWVSFNEADTGAPPSNDPCVDASCIAKASPSGQLGKSNVPIYGWARALSHDSNWDGWLRFDHGQANPAYIARDGQFQGWAWGSNIVGWVSFNCQDQGVCTTSDYKVRLPLNQVANPPSGLGKTFYPCAWGMSPQVALGLAITLNWTYTDPDGDPQAGYEIWLDDSPSFAGAKFNKIVEPSSASSYALDLNQDTEGDWLSSLAWNKTYYWKVRVKDSGSGNWSDFSSNDSFTTPVHAAPRPDFTWTPQSPSVGAIVYFSDQTFFYSGSAGWLWDLGDGTATTTQNPIHGYSQVNIFHIVLQSTDSDGFACSVAKDISVTVPLPKWKEIAP